MTTAPNPTTFLAAGVERDQGTARGFFEQWIAWAQEKPAGAAATQLTIAAGAVTPTRAAHSIETEAAAATDDLANIVTTNLEDGSWLLVWAADATHTIVVKHDAGGAGGIHLASAADFSIDDDVKTLLLRRSGADWYEIGRFYGTPGEWRSFLGLAIGANVQAWDDDLDAYAALATAGMVARTGAGAAAVRAITAGTATTVTNGDGVAGNPTIGVAAGGIGATQLADDGVTDAKLRDSAALSVVGRASNSAGDPADVAASADGQVLGRLSSALGFSSVSAFLDAALGSTQGMVLYRGASAWSALAVGASGTVLKCKGAAANPAWEYDDEVFLIAVSDQSTALTTGTAKMTWRMPYAFTLTSIPRAALNTASSSGSPTFDINEAGNSILGANKLSIDANEKTSVSAATATTLADTSLADDAEMSVDIDLAGTGAKGAVIILFGHRT